MGQQHDLPTAPPSIGVLGVYLKRGVAVIIGVALAVGFYMIVIRDQPAAQGVQMATAICRCPVCGLMIEKSAGLDCEELNCPNCGNRMGSAAMLAAAGGAQPGAGVVPPQTQNQRETRAERGGARFVGAPLQAPPPEGAVCVCPNCGKQIKRQPGIDCSMVVCPNCHSHMTNPIYVGTAPPAPQTGEVRLAGGVTGGRGIAPCPGPHGQQLQGGVAINAPTSVVPANTYSDSIRPILEKNCYRCHSGPMRNLTTYNNVKSYADNGLLPMMTQPGGPMSRFLSASEYHAIDNWVKNGSPP